MLRSVLAAALAALALPAAAQVGAVEEAVPGVQFNRPLGVERAPGEPGTLYVLEQGRGSAPPRVLAVDPATGSVATFLDLSDRAQDAPEGGLLGLAFHPDYPANGRVFVSYTAPPRGEGVLSSRLSEFARGADGAADPASERILLEVEQPLDNHNGGTVRFGPDGLLYWALGDGGGAGDPFDNGLDPTTLLGAILRVDVDDVPAGEPYGIPDDNPFAATDGPERDEIYAYGLRNPFKFSVQGSGLWAGDVGQGKWEEVNRVEAGGNYGWNAVEGPECFTAGCDLAAFDAPVHVYDHGPEGGLSITGGYVVEARDLALTDHYLFGDFISGRLWALPLGGGEAFLLLDEVPNGGDPRAPNISSIDPGLGGDEVLLTDYVAGRIYRIEIRGASAAGAPEAGPALALAGPSPFRTRTAVEVAGPARVALVDVRGREVAVLHDGPGGRVAVDGAGLAPGAYAVVARGPRGASVRWVVRAR